MITVQDMKTLPNPLRTSPNVMLIFSLGKERFVEKYFVQFFPHLLYTDEDDPR